MAGCEPESALDTQAIINALQADRKAIQRRFNILINTLGPLHKKYTDILLERVDKLERDHKESIGRLERSIEAERKLNELMDANIRAVNGEASEESSPTVT